MGSRLGDAMSPYLRAHASNPVDWYPWGEAAFAEARERDVPVLISIGYATCHWCHVMARESFSDPAVAAVLNEGFVAIKVDREEHPDVDASYLAAASAFTRELGWPLTVFASPEGRAFYAGTYFPPREIRGAPAFMTVLAAVGEAWRERRQELEATATAVGEALAAASAVRTDGALPGRADLDGAVDALAVQEDRVHGGFGGAPKFPVAPVLEFLAVGGGPGRALAERTVRLMGASPLHDPVDGGFFRYATRADWTEPHYERMLTDNALLLRVATELGRAWPGDEHTVSIADGVARFLIDRLQLPNGGFASAQDSESVIDGERSEGGYYRQDAEGRALLTPPPLDEKVLTGWNGLAISALARHGFVRGDARSVAAAKRCADLLLAAHLLPDGRPVRASLDGRVSTAVATLEDTGMFAGGLLELAAVTGESGYAVAARTLVDAAMSAASAARAATAEGDGEGQIPFAAPGGGDPVLRARGLELPDDPAEGAAPSGLTACADAAWRLYLLGAGDHFLSAAEQAMASVAGIALERPLAFGGALALMARLAAPVVQLVTVMPERSDDLAPGPEEPALVAATRGHEASVAVIVDERQAREFAAAGFSLFEERTARNGVAVAYRCEAFICALPVEDPSRLGALGPRE